MDITNTDVCFQAPRRSSFSIKNILNLHDERALTAFPRVSGEEIDYAKVSIIRPMVSPITYAMNPPPLMRYPYAGLGSPLSGISLNWSADPTAQANFPAWICNTSFLQSYEHFHGFSPYINLPRRRRFSRKKKQRPLFSQNQVQTMEKEFTKHRYISESKRAELSTELGLTETQVKTWFQNRRTKWRKEIQDQVATTVSQTNKNCHQNLSGTSSYNDELSAPAASSRAYTDLFQRDTSKSWRGR